IRAIVHTILHLRIRPTPFPYTTLFRSKDLYFPPEDEAWSVQHIPDAELRVIPGIWGHLAGGGADPDAAASGSAPPPARCPQMPRSEEHTSELSHGSSSYAAFCLQKNR